MTKNRNKYIILNIEKAPADEENVNIVNWRDYKAEKSEEIEMPLSEKIKATWTGLSVLL